MNAVERHIERLKTLSKSELESLKHELDLEEARFEKGTPQAKHVYHKQKAVEKLLEGK